MKLTREEQNMIMNSLNMQHNWIETGCVTMSASDAARNGCHKEIKPLTDDQKKHLRRIEDLIEKVKQL